VCVECVTIYLSGEYTSCVVFILGQSYIPCQCVAFDWCVWLVQVPIGNTLQDKSNEEPDGSSCITHMIKKYAHIFVRGMFHNLVTKCCWVNLHVHLSFLCFRRNVHPVDRSAALCFRIVHPFVCAYLHAPWKRHFLISLPSTLVHILESLWNVSFCNFFVEQTCAACYNSSQSTKICKPSWRVYLFAAMLHLVQVCWLSF